MTGSGLSEFDLTTDHKKDHENIWLINNPTGENGLIGIDKIGDKVRFFDPKSYKEQTVLDIKNHHEVTISPDHKIAYVSEFGKFARGRFAESGQNISVLDLENRKVIRQINTAPFKGPHGMRLDGQGQLWVIFEESGELGVIDIETQKLVETYNVGTAKSRPPFIEMLPDGSKIYISSKLGNIVVFDVKNQIVKGEIDVPFGTEGIAVSPDGSRIILAENTEQKLLVIDTSSDQIVDQIPLLGAVLSNPARSRLVRIRFTLDGNTLVSTNYASGIVHVHDGANLREQVMLPVAKGPQGIAFTADQNHAVISNHDCGIATIVNLRSQSVVDWFEFGDGIETLTFY